MKPLMTIIIVCGLIFLLSGFIKPSISGMAVSYRKINVSCERWGGVLEMKTSKGILVNSWDGVASGGQIQGSFYPIASFEGTWGEGQVRGSFDGYDPESELLFEGSWTGFVANNSFEGSIKGTAKSGKAKPAQFTGMIQGSCLS